MRNSASIIALFFVFVAGAPNVRADTIMPVASYIVSAYGALEQEGSFSGNGNTLSASETFVNPFDGGRVGQISEWASVSSSSAAVNAQAIADTSGVDAGVNASITYFITVKQFAPTAVNSVILDVTGSVSFASSALSGGYNFADASIELDDNATGGPPVALIEGSSNCLLGGCTAPSGEAEEEVTPFVGVGDLLEFTLQARCVVSGYPGTDGTCSALADPAVTIDPRSPDAADFGLQFSSNLPQAPAAQVPEPCTLAFVLFGLGLVLAMQKRTRWAIRAKMETLPSCLG